MSIRLTRRALVGAGGGMLARPMPEPAGSVYGYVGSYTTEKRYARGDGIHVFRHNAETAQWTHVQHIGNLVNPSFLAVRPDQRFLYSVHGDETYATSFSVDRATGHLTMLNRVETGGRNGVHLAIDQSGRFIIVANYTSGNVASIPIRPDGTLGEPVQTVALQGQPGPHRIEQASSHPHHVLFDRSGRFVVVPDKGLDRVFVFGFDAATGMLTPTAQGSAIARPGFGPRHAAFHPTLPVLWVLNEIANTVTTYYWEAERGHLRAVQILPTLPPEYTGENTASGIAVSAKGRFVYCSNRGHDSVAAFAADPNTGALSAAGWTSSQGRTPRFIGFDLARRFLFVANEQSDTIMALRADAATGRLTRAGEMVRNASPAAIAFAQA